MAASTHAKEEALILQSIVPNEDEVLVIVPRHPERFDTVDVLLEAYVNEHNLSYHRFSKQANFESDVILVDCLGELVNIYAISDIVVLGGAFEPIGGHNPIEPAFFKNAIITGKQYFNQKALMPLVTNLHVCENEALNEMLAKRDSLEISTIEGDVDMSPFYTYIEREIEHGKR